MLVSPNFPLAFMVCEIQKFENHCLEQFAQRVVTMNLFVSLELDYSEAMFNSV